MRRGFRVAATLGRLRALPGTPCLLPIRNPATAFGSSMASRVSSQPGEMDSLSPGVLSKPFPRWWLGQAGSVLGSYVIWQREDALGTASSLHPELPSQSEFDVATNETAFLL